MKRTGAIGLFFAALFGLCGQAPAPAPKTVLHLVYEFGFNTKVAKAGQGTGTTTIDISGPVADGGVMITGSDYWWNTARPRGANTCEVYPNGKVNCGERPYAISPIQLTLFPLLASNYFNGLSASGNSTWKHSFSVYAAIIAGGSSTFANTPTTWKTSFSMTGEGPIPNGGNAVLVVAKGTFEQQGGHYLTLTSKQRIAYDTVLKVPVAVSDLRTKYPQRSVYNNDLVELKLTQDSHAKLHANVSPP